MLRIILRHTFNALLFACILLLLCSFERFCRYDFAQIQLTTAASSTGVEQQPSGSDKNNNNKGSSTTDVLQVDHFVFWGGIPAWERSLEAKNPVSLGLFKFMSFSAGSSWRTSTTTTTTTTNRRRNTRSSSGSPPPVTTTATAAAEESTTTTIKSEEEEEKDQVVLDTAAPEHADVEPTATATTAIPLIDAKIILRRQIRHHKKRQHSRSNDKLRQQQQQQDVPGKRAVNEAVPSLLLSAESSSSSSLTTQTPNVPEKTLQGRDETTVNLSGSSSRSASSVTMADHRLPQSSSSSTMPMTSPPTIGFILHLPSCDREEIASWKRVWNEQAIDQPFLFHVLLAPTVDGSCLADLTNEFNSYNNNNNNGDLDNIHDRLTTTTTTKTGRSKHDGDDADADENIDDTSILYQASQKEHMAMALQTCQNQDKWLDLLRVQEVLYYDASKAKGRIRSSATMRRFVRSKTTTTTTMTNKEAVAAAAAISSSSSFQCTGGGQKPAFCDVSVLDCPWFQYAPPLLVPISPTTTARDASSTTDEAMTGARFEATIS